jgi:hypothetical protein
MSGILEHAGPLRAVGLAVQTAHIADEKVAVEMHGKVSGQNESCMAFCGVSDSCASEHSHHRHPQLPNSLPLYRKQQRLVAVEKHQPSGKKRVVVKVEGATPAPPCPDILAAPPEIIYLRMMTCRGPASRQALHYASNSHC